MAKKQNHATRTKKIAVENLPHFCASYDFSYPLYVRDQYRIEDNLYVVAIEYNPLCFNEGKYNSIRATKFEI